ncbi:MAG: dienelactone hydrolase family protein [Proteobacteria bacterium]|nr:dienelactone hydrolase family protein [Pseudomonadota bacterium]
MNSRLFSTARTLLFITIFGSVIGWAATTRAEHDSGNKTPLSGGDTGDVEYPNLMGDLELEGELELPDKMTGKVPAMIIAHGSAGIDDRENDWADFLRANGIASFVIDYFGPRGIDRYSSKQPMPTTDVILALKILSTHPKIDPDRIGVIGFSRGAHLAVHSANLDASWGGGHALAAHVGLYPICQRISVTEGGSEAPILVLIGTKDSYTKPEYCERFAKNAKGEGRDVKVIVYEGAYHGWDGSFSGSWYHAAARTQVEFQTDYEITKKSRKDVLEFLKGPLKLK